jgi:hypothetical protein
LKPPTLLRHQSLAPESIAKRVGVRGLGEAKGDVELPFIVPPASTPDLNAALAMKGQDVFAFRAERQRQLDQMRIVPLIHARHNFALAGHLPNPKASRLTSGRWTLCCSALS